RTVIPFVVCQIGRLTAGERHPAIPFAVRAVTRRAIALIEFLPGLDRFRVFRLGILELLRFGVATWLLGLNACLDPSPRQRQDTDPESQRRQTARGKLPIPEGHQNSPPDIQAAARADAGTVREPD